MTQAIVPKELLTATTGGLSLLVVSGGADGQVLTQQADGTYAPEAPSSGGTPGGSSGQVQYNNAGAFGGMTAVVYAGTGTHLEITAQAAATIPLCLKAAASQTGDLLQLQTSAAAVRMRIASSGRTITFDDNGSIQSTSGFLTLQGLGISGSYQIQQSATAAMNQVITFGNGTCQSDIVPGAVRVTGTNAATSASTNQTGGTVTVRAGDGGPTNSPGGVTQIAGGRGRGTGTPGSVVMQTCVAGSSGTTLQTLRDSLQIDGNTTSGETPMLLLDLAAGTLKRVSIGASDSGGTGFKVLRVTN